MAVWKNIHCSSVLILPKKKTIIVITIKKEKEGKAMHFKLKKKQKAM